MKRNGNAERRRRENRGAEGANGNGSGEGVSPFPVGERSGEGAVPLPIIFFDLFLSGNSAFWCILGACFNVSIRRVKTESKSSFVCQLSIGQLSHMAVVSSMISYT